MTALNKWRDHELYDWGTRGLRLRNGCRLPSPTTGRPRATFDPAWLGEWDELASGTCGSISIIREARKLTPDIYLVRKRRGKLWPRGRYIMPRWALLKACEIVADRREVTP